MLLHRLGFVGTRTPRHTRGPIACQEHWPSLLRCRRLAVFVHTHTLAQRTDTRCDIKEPPTRAYWRGFMV